MIDATRRWATAVFLTLFGTSCTGTISGPVEGTALDGGQPPSGADAGVAHADAATPQPPDAQPTPPALATGIQIRDIAVYQGVEIPIASDGASISSRNAPIVEGADAMIGVYVDLTGEWQAREVVARLAIDAGFGEESTYEDTRVISAPSGTDPTATSFSFQVSGADITTAATYSVGIYETSTDADYPGVADGARFPSTGSTDLGAQSTNGAFNLVLVPFRYDADGSGRLPPLDESALDVYREKFLSMYPIAQVNLSVREPVSYTSTIGATTGWSNWLDALTSVREQDAPPANTFYYGVASPASSWNQFCSSGCVAGLGWVPGRDTEYLRAAVGVSFPDGVSVGTALHEVGHTLGRSHTPCGNPSGVDPEYPYAGGYLGVWGFDILEQSLKDPDQYTDIMGYCNKQWISDYTYAGIFERIAYANQGNAMLLPTPRTYRVGLVDGNGTIRWRRYATPRSPIVGTRVRTALLDADGVQRGEVDAHFFPYDHIEGGMLLVPVPDGELPVTVRATGLAEIAW